MERAGAGPHGGHMTTVRLWSSALCSLVPCVGLLAAIALTGGGVADVDPLYLVFVAVPSMVAIVAGRAAFTRLVLTLVMTGVAVFAGVQITSVDDGQAGFAAISLPMVGFPLAGAVWYCETIEAYRRVRDGDRP
jgi:hypothetical protein